MPRAEVIVYYPMEISLDAKRDQVFYNPELVFHKENKLSIAFFLYGDKQKPQDLTNYVIDMLICTNNGDTENFSSGNGAFTYKNQEEGYFVLDSAHSLDQGDHYYKLYIEEVNTGDKTLVHDGYIAIKETLCL